jgi:transposase
LDTLNPATAGETRRSTIMARKNYTDEFRRQAVDLYRSTPGATLRGIAADLGISRHTLNEWVRAQTATVGNAGAHTTAGATAGGASQPGRTGGLGRRRGCRPRMS